MQSTPESHRPDNQSGTGRVGAAAGRFASPYLLLVLTVLFWSINFVVGRAVRDDIGPVSLSFWRWTVALMVLSPFAWSYVRVQWRIIICHWRMLIVFGVLGVANFNAFVYIGLQSTTATNAVLVNSMTPVTIVALGWLFLGRAFTLRRALGMALSLFGVVVIIMRGEPVALIALRFNPGDFWILAAMASWALYSVCLTWRPAELHPLSFLAATICVGIVVLAPFYAWEAGRGVPLNVNLLTVSSLLYLGIFPSVLAFIFWNRAVLQVGAGKAGQFMYLLPVFGTILSIIFLGETLRLFHLAGVSLIFSGVYLSTNARAGA